MDAPPTAGQPKTLYVGNLDPSVTEELIMALFGQMGPVKGCKIIREMAHFNPNAANGYPPQPPDPYAFVEFANHDAALAALTAMNKRQCMNRELRVNWAANSGGVGAGSGGGHGGGHGGMGGGGGPKHQQKVDTSSHHHIFVGDLSPEIETETLRNAFAPFGEISDCRVVRDPTTLKSKGYGFCSFVKKEDAQTAIEQMNGQFLGSRSIRTNWATRKPPPLGGGGGNSYGDHSKGHGKPLDYDTVFNQASEMNHTVYVGGLAESDDNQIRRAFSTFGRIQEVRYFKDKGYAFVRFDNKESACNAIVALNMTEISGSTVKCSWGKEGGGNPQPHGGYGGPPPHHQGGYPPHGGYGGYQGGQQFYHQQPPQQYMYPPQQGYMMAHGGNQGGYYQQNPYDYQAAGGYGQ